MFPVTLNIKLLHFDNHTRKMYCTLQSGRIAEYYHSHICWALGRLSKGGVLRKSHVNGTNTRKGKYNLQLSYQELSSFLQEA